jgi:hypothetical protein
MVKLPKLLQRVRLEFLPCPSPFLNKPEQNALYDKSRIVALAVLRPITPVNYEAPEPRKPIIQIGKTNEKSRSNRETI